MNKRLGILSLILLLILIIVAGIILFRNDWMHSGTQPDAKPTPTADVTADPAETPEAAESPTPEPTQDPETDERFYNTDSLLVVANKKHKLPDGYEPADLRAPAVEMRYNTWTMRDEAAAALEQMFAAAAQENIHLVMGSGYRSEAFQKVLYDQYVARDGVEKADTYSSRPGYSDHQTGLATDLCGPEEVKETDLTQKFEETAEGQWLRVHAHEYGFIMRYPKDKDEITGYKYEPWHFRYVGIETATAIYNAGEFESFEEYFGISGGGYAD